MTARVLVVDDIPPNVKLLEARLSVEYYDVITASDGPSALKAVTEQMPDIILLDVMMPGMDGYEVCRRLKADRKTAHIPVVMVTALNEPRDRVLGLEAGADDFLTKPINDVALFARIRSLVRLKTMMDELSLRQQTSSELGVLESSDLLDEDVTQGAKILVVDDDFDGDVIEEALADNHVVQRARDPDEAAKAARETEYDLIIVSLLMNEHDGLRICSHLRSQAETRQVPLVMLIEESDTDRLVKGLDMGVNDYLMKPIDTNELLARTRSQIRRKRYQERLRAAYHHSMSMAVTDELTGLYNRRYLTQHMATVSEHARESHRPMSLLVLDVDFFKKINDTYGHAAGDEVLRQVADRVTHSVRAVDFVARYGGEEFVVVMPDTNIEAATDIAERLCHQIRRRPFSMADPIGEIAATVSIGVACSDSGADSPEALFQAADAALYSAKRTGRNKTVIGEVSPARALEAAQG